MRRTKRTLAATMTLALCLGSSLTAMAAPKVMSDGNVFDAEYYAQNNPDVVNALGTDENMLYLHYTLYGRTEGRLAVAPGTDTDSMLYSDSVQRLDVSKLPHATDNYIRQFKYPTVITNGTELYTTDGMIEEIEFRGIESSFFNAIGVSYREVGGSLIFKVPDVLTCVTTEYFGKADIAKDVYEKAQTVSAWNMFINEQTYGGSKYDITVQPISVPIPYAEDNAQ